MSIATTEKQPKLNENTSEEATVKISRSMDHKIRNMDSDITGNTLGTASSYEYMSKATMDLQKTLRKFVVAFIKEQPDDIIDYAVSHFTDLQRRRIQPTFIGNLEHMPSKIDSLFSNDVSELVLDEDAVSVRSSVFSETFDSKGSTESDNFRYILPKTDSQRARLLTTLQDCLMLRNLEPEKMNNIVDAMYELFVQAGENIIVEGTEGDNFYIIEKGKFNVIKEGNQIATMTRGTFGEMALLYTIPRTATVEAATAGRLWVLDRETFRNILQKHALREMSKYQDLVNNSPFLKSLDKYKLMKLLEVLEPREYSKGEQITRIGSPSHGVHFIQEGQCSIYSRIEGEENETFETYFSKGSFFGEIELILDTMVFVNVYAETDVKTAFLKANYFENFLGFAVDKLTEHMLEYDIRDEYVADKIRTYIMRSNYKLIR